MNRLPHLILATMSALWLVSVALAAAPITQIVIETDPTDAEVLVDGVVKSKDTPASMLAVSVSAGTHTVDIRKPGMHSERRTVDIGEGVTQKLEKIVLHPEPPFDFSAILAPHKDSFETPEQFVARVHKQYCGQFSLLQRSPHGTLSPKIEYPPSISQENAPCSCWTVYACT